MGKIVNQDLPADPPAPSAGSHVIYSKAAGVFVRTPTGVVGPLSAGGTVNDLQDAYDGGNTINVVAGTPVALTGGATGDVLTSETTGTGSAIYAETSGDGNGVTVYATGATGANRDSVLAIVDASASNSTALRALVNSTAVGAKGLVVDLTASGAQGNGVEVGVASTGVGLGVQQAGDGNGIYVLSGSTANAAIQAVASGSGTAHAIKAEVTDPASTGAGLHIEYAGTGNAIEVQDTSPATVFSVDSAGNTTTPSVVFGGSRITVEGDSGVAGEPINPRVSLTSGAVDVGVLDRVYTFYSKVTGPIDLELVISAQNTTPTVFQFSNTSGVSQNINLLNADRYPNGAEIIVLNTGTDAINLTDAVGRTLTDLAISGVSPVNISGNAGRRLMALNFGVGGGSGSTYWVVTGTI